MYMYTFLAYGQSLKISYSVNYALYNPCDNAKYDLIMCTASDVLSLAKLYAR